MARKKTVFQIQVVNGYCVVAYFRTATKMYGVYEGDPATRPYQMFASQLKSFKTKAEAFDYARSLPYNPNNSVKESTVIC